jgi:uncharacterized protein YecT (DUF1311 family)
LSLGDDPSFSHAEAIADELSCDDAISTVQMMECGSCEYEEAERRLNDVCRICWRDWACGQSGAGSGAKDETIEGLRTA